MTNVDVKDVTPMPGDEYKSVTPMPGGIPNRPQILIVECREPPRRVQLERVRQARLRDFQLPQLAFVAREVVVKD